MPTLGHTHRLEVLYLFTTLEPLQNVMHFIGTVSGKQNGNGSADNFFSTALCVNNSETSSPSTISVGAEKDSHLHEQDQW
jgi:hypothetical protein